MASPMVTRIANGLARFKQIEEKPETLSERSNAMRQLMIELTNFNNLPPCV